MYHKKVNHLSCDTCHIVLISLPLFIRVQLVTTKGASLWPYNMTQRKFASRLQMRYFDHEDARDGHEYAKVGYKVGIGVPTSTSL